MNNSNNRIFPVLQKCYEDLKQQSDLFEEKRSRYETLKREIEIAQGRLQQAENLTASLITQAIEESLDANVRTQLASINGRFLNSHLMLQAIPASDTVWMVSVLVADLFQQVDLPTDRPIKVWVYDPKQRLGSQYDLSGTFLRVGNKIPGINVEHGIQLQFAVDVLNGDIVTQANYVVPFQLPEKQVASEEGGLVVEGEVTPDAELSTGEVAVEVSDTTSPSPPDSTDEDQH